MPSCQKCGKKLNKIGNERKNGKHYNNNNGNDWSTRKLHKKCWFEVKAEQEKIICNNEISMDDKITILKIIQKKYNLNKLI